MSFKLLVLILFVSLVLAAGLLGYRLFYQTPVADSSAVTGSGIVAQGLSGSVSGGQTSLEDADYNRLLRVIAGITKIDRSLFTKPAFVSLFNFTVNIPNPVPGRRNPFAPVGLP